MRNTITSPWQEDADCQELNQNYGWPGLPYLLKLIQTLTLKHFRRVLTLQGSTRKHMGLFCLVAFPRFPCGCCLAVARCRRGDATLPVHISGSLIRSVLSLSLSHWSSLVMASLVTTLCFSHHVLRLPASHLAPLSSLSCHYPQPRSLRLSPSLVSGLADYQLMAQI